MKRAILLQTGLGSAATVIFGVAGVCWGWAALIAFVGWPLVGTLVTIDDDDFEDAEGKPIRPPWFQSQFWGQICLGLAIAAFVASADGTWGAGGTALAVGITAAVAAAKFLSVTN